MTVFRKKIKFLFLLTLTSSIIVVIFAYLLGRLLSPDISLEPILPEANPDFRAEKFSHRPGVYLISYADGPEVYFKNQNMLASSAFNKGIDFVLNYRRSHLDSAFVKQYASILNQKKGAGYWLWKPWIILKTLETIPENAVLVYFDTGLAFRKPITPLLELAKQNDIILFEYDPKRYHGIPINIAKREIFIKLDCDREECHRGRHVWSGALILRNTSKSRALVKKWLAYCCDERLLTDKLDPSVKQHPEFKVQYHDEAILNVLYNKEPKGKYLFPAKILFEKYATWHHRYAKIEDYSLLMAIHHDQYSKAYKTEDEILNNYLTLLLRKISKLFSSS